MELEKRVSPRFLFNEPIEYGHQEIIVNGSIAANISLSGISLRVQGFIPLKTILELQLRLGSASQVIWVKAQVVRIREVMAEGCFEIGLQFIKDENCIKAIGGYVMACRSNQQTKESNSHG